MQTKLLLSTSIIAIPAALFAAELWQQKSPADWSEKDCSKLVAKSPWAKDTAISMGGMGGGGGTGGGGGGRGGRGGGGMGGGASEGATGGGGGMGGGGGRGGAGGGRGGGEMGAQMPEAPHVVIRWDSAAPVREAMKKVSLSKAVDEDDVKAFYIVTVDGLRFPRRPGAPVRPGQASGPRPLPSDQFDNLKNVTSLTAKGKDPVQPGKADMALGEDGMMTVRFYFPRSADFSLDDKEVTFQTKLMRMEVKQKFSMKDMTFDGRLAL